MKKILLSTLIALLFIIPFNVFADEDEEDEEILFNLKEQIIYDFKDTDYTVNDVHIVKNGKEVFTLINDLDNTLVFKVSDSSLSNEDTKELLLDVLANSIQVDGSYSFVCSNDLSYFVFSNDEERVYRISNINSNNEIKVSLIKNEDYINPEFNVNFDDYTITNGDPFTHVTKPNKNDSSNSEDNNHVNVDLPDGYTKEEESDETIIKDSEGNDSFSIIKKEDEIIIKVEDDNNLNNDEIEEFVKDTVTNTYNITKEDYDIKFNGDSSIVYEKKDGSMSIVISKGNNENEFVVSVKDNVVNETVVQNNVDTTKQIMVFEAIAIIVLIILVLILGISYIKNNRKKKK